MVQFVAVGRGSAGGVRQGIARLPSRSGDRARWITFDIADDEGVWTCLQAGGVRSVGLTGNPAVDLGTPFASSGRSAVVTLCPANPGLVSNDVGIKVTLDAYGWHRETAAAATL